MAELSIWPPFPQPEGLLSVSDILWFAAAAAGVLLGLQAGTTKRWGRQMGIATVILLITVVSYAQFNAERMITFRGDDASQEVTFVLPLWACSTSAQFEPSGVARDLALPGDLRDLVQRPNCRAAMMVSTLPYLVLTGLFIVSASALLFAALAAMVRDRRLSRVLARIRALMRSLGIIH